MVNEGREMVFDGCIDPRYSESKDFPARLGAETVSPPSEGGSFCAYSMKQQIPPLVKGEGRRARVSPLFIPQ